MGSNFLEPLLQYLRARAQALTVMGAFRPDPKPSFPGITFRPLDSARDLQCEALL